MRSDEEVGRDLLARAAATIPVGPAPEVGHPRRRMLAWPLLAAAAAVVAVVLVAVQLVGPGGDQTPSDHVTSYRLPSFFGLDAERATAILERAGVRGRIVHDSSDVCAPFHPVVSSVPAVGTALRRGDVVELTDTRGPAGGRYRCPYQVRPDKWDPIRFVLRGRPISWASTVRIYLNGRLSRTLTGTQAADPLAWGSSLDGLRRVATQVQTVDGRSRYPTVIGGFIGDDGSQQLCGVRWMDLGVYSSTYASVGLPGQADCERQQIAVSVYEIGDHTGYNQVQIYDPTKLSRTSPTG